MNILDRFFKLAGMVIAASLDLAVGSLIVAIVVNVFSVLGHHIIAPWYYYIIGALVGLFPDLDIFTSYNVMSGGVYQKKHHHEKIPHYPLLVLPAVFFAGGLLITMCNYASAPIFWLTVVESCLLWHYLHDSKWTGGHGINWLYPFSRIGIFNREDEYNKWLHGEILRPSFKTAVGVVFVAIIICVVVIQYTIQYSHSLLIGVALGSIILISVNAVWTLHGFCCRESHCRQKK